ncbi:CHASE domain-containing protein [Aureliella helgolandensis]|uniref:histidine kinase n=1 Tax=Aureliella helgolandensis TaxID=2527968 RepID=A0A518G6C5_9BACT|nr:CHASE domain-containing protein [Aureliella helgolandensis]QDV24135.1 Phytochrome-like protein cph1 [Aureliella helgolandensis]
MDLSANRHLSPAQARQKLESASAFHWIHWLIVILSTLVTLFAWHFTSSEKHAKDRVQFDRQADQILELVRERMQKYEEALWSGVALIHSADGKMDRGRWNQYADCLNLDQRYQGINGIGVIYAVKEGDRETFLTTQRESRPDFKIYPEHDGEECFPIAYISPEKENLKALGLDMAHEPNRWEASQQARETGVAQITGPINLVQEDSHTPGFLFFAPFYAGDRDGTAAERHEHFLGMVFAPFVMRKLMEGTLQKDKRQVGFRVADGTHTLYNELLNTEPDFDPHPQFTRSVSIPTYGRDWTFQISSSKSFREATRDFHPLSILVGGICLDAMLIWIFFVTSRTAQRSLKYARSMTEQLEQNYEQVQQEVADRMRAEEALTQTNASLQQSQASLEKLLNELKRSNAELEQFAYVASHDLQEPLRKISSYGQLLREDYGEFIQEEGNRYLDVMVSGANRLKNLVSDLLTFSRIRTRGQSLEAVDPNAALQIAIEQLEVVIKECDCQLTYDEFPWVMADKGQLVQLFQNLIGNAIKYRGEKSPVIHVGGHDAMESFQFSVADNGIGIDPQFHQRIFEIFQRLHNRREYSGTGIGLAICKRIVERFGGDLLVESEIGEGSTFSFTLNKASFTLNKASQKVPAYAVR